LSKARVQADGAPGTSYSGRIKGCKCQHNDQKEKEGKVI